MEARAGEIEGGRAPKRRLPDLGGRSPKIGSVFIAPGRLLLLFIIAFPAVVAIYIGFTEWTPTGGDNVWGAHRYWHWFDGYWEALSSRVFWDAMWRTVLIVAVCVAAEFALGFLLALLLIKQFIARGIVVVFFLLPMMVVPAVTGFIFFMLFQIDGPVNEALSLIFSSEVRIEWLRNANYAIWTVMLADIWQWTPLMFLIFLSGLAALPEDQMNAARILGASWFDQMRYLVLPMLKPIILIALIIRGIEAFKLFDPIIFMTQGGPGDATQNISVYLYRQTIINGRWGYASAVAIIVLIFVSIVGLRAIRPIERAQEESMEELVGPEPTREPGDRQRTDEAIEAGARI